MKRALLVMDILNGIFKIGYLWNKTNSYSVLMWLFGISYVKNQNLSSSLMPFQSWMGTSLFLIRFVDWNKTQSGMEVSSSSDVVPPPEGSSLKIGVCALCNNPLNEPVSVPSGIAYCTSCLLSYRTLNENKCPFTGTILEDTEIVQLLL